MASNAKPGLPRGAWAAIGLLIALGIATHDISAALSRLPPNGSILEDGRISVGSAAGIPRHVIQGPLSVEGAAWSGVERSIVLGAAQGTLAVDFDRPVVMRALLLQATDRTPYVVETSIEGSAWTEVWRREPQHGRRGVVSDHHVFATPIGFDKLRLRHAGSAGLAVVSALRAYESPPEGWPLLGPDSPPDLGPFPWLTLVAVTALKCGIAWVSAALLVLLWQSLRTRRPSARRIRAIDGALALAAVLAAFGWYNFMQYSAEEWARMHFNYWDANHYYMAAKYAPEVGYDGLYECFVVADAKAGLGAYLLEAKGLRALSTNRVVGMRRILADPASCTDRFEDPARWAAFQADRASLRSRLNAPAQMKLLRDHGYNGTPVWTLIGRALGALGPADDLRLRIAFAVDPILIAGSFGLIGATFGLRAMALAGVLFGTGWAFGNWFTGAAIVRFGWFAAAVSGVCLLKRERWMLAGALLAAAVLLRLFPVFIVGGVVLGAMVDMVDRRSFAPSQAARRIALGGVIATMLLVAASLPAAGGVDAWKDFAANTLKHTATASGQNIGFEAMIRPLYDEGIAEGGHFRGVDKRRLARLGTVGVPEIARGLIALGTLGLLGWALRRRPPWIAAILGLAWMGFALDISNYYYAAAILFAPLCLEAPVLLLPYALLLVVWSGLGLVYDYENLYMYALASAALLVFSASALAVFAFGRRPDSSPEDG